MARIPRLAVSFLVVALSTPENARSNEVVAAEPDTGATPAPVADDAAVRPDRILTSPTQLTPKLRASLGLPNSDTGAEAFGDGNHPYTTARASAQDEMSPVDAYPWRAAGKMFMSFGGQTFVCTASVIELNLLVTAAHCVHNFGQEMDGFADAVTFEPARHEGERPFGTWTGRTWYIPKVYFDGTDVCSPNAPGVVCENDVAVVVLEPDDDGQKIADVVGRYGVIEFDEYGYAFFLGQRAAQLTQLGYPSDQFDGDKMIRSDSVGIWDDPFNVVWGSGQTGGSSGGPELQNFGTPHSGTGPAANDADPNMVSSTTSWGFINGTAKVQGASRFSKNTSFTEKSNIMALMTAACADHPDACD